MKSRIGVVGPQKSTHLIEEVGREYLDSLVLVPFTYARMEETQDIVEHNEHLVDIWLFSGRMPYLLAQSTTLSKPAFFLPLDSSSLTKALFQVARDTNLSLGRLSIDSMQTHVVQETFGELGLDASNVQVYSYAHYQPVENLLSFHRDCYETGRVEACITAVRSVYDALHAYGIPVFRIEPTRLSVRQTLETAYQQGQTLEFQRAQMTVQVIEFRDLNKRFAQNLNSYDVYRLSLKLQETVVEYTEQILGSFIPLGDNKFMVFSTRGSLQEYGARMHSLLNRIHAMTDLSVHVGIGYGTTTLAAEKNAYLALDYASQYESATCAILIDEHGNVHGPLHETESITFLNRTENAYIIEQLESAGISIGTYNKILAVQQSVCQSAVSAALIAEWLGMTKRNASRILASLEKSQLARIVGKEMPLGHGRPRLIYRVGDVQRE